MQSDATTVGAYLKSLPGDRRAAISAVRKAILSGLPRGYEETMIWGMITYQVPISECPVTYNGQPLMYAALASQKNHMAVYLTGVYMDPALRSNFESAYRASGKRMDMGKSCVRFRKLENLPLDLITTSIAAIPMKEFVKRVGQIQSAHPARKPR